MCKEEDLTINLTETELNLLNSIDTDLYKWITRDEDNSLYLFSTKPNRNREKNIWDSEDKYISFEAYNHMFGEIKWENNRPLKILDLIKKDQEENIFYGAK